MPDKPGGVRGIVLVPQLSRDQIRKIALIDLVEHMKECKEILNQEEEAMMEQGIGIVSSILDGIEPEEKSIEFKCTECEKTLDAYVSEEQVPRNAPRPLKTRHECDNCGEKTIWKSTDYTEIEIE